MRIVKIIGGVVAGVAVLAAGALLLPGQVTVERRAVIAADAAEILALAGSGAGYQVFNPYAKTDPDLKIALFGPESGVGSGFSFDGRDGKGSQTVTAISATSVEYQIDLGAMGKPVQSMQIVETAEGSEVIWTMNADLGMNPVARVFGLFMDGMVGPSLEAGLDGLADAVVQG